MPPDLSVVINTRDHAESLRMCLNALESQTLEASRWEVVVVDDGSPDDSTALVAENYAGRSPCRVLRRAHAGRAAARNAGIAAAAGEVVLFLGDDILAAPDLLERHLAEHAAHPRSAVVGLYEWHPRSPSAAFRRWVDNCRFDRIGDGMHATHRHFYTGNASAPRAAVTEAGGFDENFTRYGWEDMDLGLRLEKRGWTIRYAPHAQAEHHHPVVTLEALCRREREMAYSAVYYFEKWAGEAAVEAERFWTGEAGAVRPGPAWRRSLGRAAIGLCERALPLPGLLDRLYDRLLWSCRFAGLREGAAWYPALLRLHAAGELPAADCERRFQR